MCTKFLIKNKMDRQKNAQNYLYKIKWMDKNITKLSVENKMDGARKSEYIL